MAHPLPELLLSDDERDTLTQWSRRRKSSQALALRCRIVLACAEGFTNTEVARKLNVSNPTVGKWRSRFVESRLDGLLDEPRPANCSVSPIHSSNSRTNSNPASLDN